MSWRKLHLILFALMAVVAFLRLMSGNILGALVPLVLAAVFGSIAFDYPLLARVRQLWKLLRWRSRRKKK